MNENLDNFYIEFDKWTNRYYPKLRTKTTSYYLDGHNYQYRTWCDVTVMSFTTLNEAKKSIEPWLKIRNSPRIVEFNL